MSKLRICYRFVDYFLDTLTFGFFFNHLHEFCSVSLFCMGFKNFDLYYTAQRNIHGTYLLSLVQKDIIWGHIFGSGPSRSVFVSFYPLTKDVAHLDTMMTGKLCSLKISPYLSVFRYFATCRKINEGI